MEKTVEIPQLPLDLHDKLLTCPLLSTTGARWFRQYRKLWIFKALTIEISQMQYIWKVVDVPVVLVVQAPESHAWWRHPRSHSLQVVEKS